MDVARELRAQARETDERRVLLVHGPAGACRRRARDALEGADVAPERTRYVGPADSFPCEQVPIGRADRLMGTTHDAVVLDCHGACRPNALGRVVGAVDGGGLLVLLAPPLAVWPDRRDRFDASLAVPPFEHDEVSGHFRRRLVETLRAHRGIAIVDADSGVVERDGLTETAPRLREESPTVPENVAFPRIAYECCRTADQSQAVRALEGLRSSGEAVVVEADRGRGKSSAVGIAAACLAFEENDVLVTAPDYRNASEVFARAGELLEGLGADVRTDREDDPRRLDCGEGCLRFEKPATAGTLPGDPDRVVVDEAAAIPVRLLEALLDADGVAFATTVHGYEGTGRGFAVRFRDRLDESSFAVTDVSMADPIRYAPADPIEVWSFRALALGAAPPVAPLVEDATPATVTHATLSPAELVADEHLLREVFGLLVLAHYRTEPNDLARLLDAPNVSVHVLCHDGHVVSVALLAREGGLSATHRRQMYEGGRIAGNMIPDVLTGQLRDPEAGVPIGQRVLRIATHSAVRSRGLGSALLSAIRSEADVDYLGVGYGATPQLVAFWRENGFSTAHLATSRNDRSGEHSVVMLNPLSERGQELLARHTSWFCRRALATFADALSAVDPDVIRAVCRATDSTPTLDLSTFEWRVAAGIGEGTAILDTAPRGVGRLVFRHLAAPETDALSPRQERLLVRKVLQAASWETTATNLDFQSISACRRALGAAVEPLVERYGDGGWSP